MFGDPRGFNKDVVRQTPEEGRRTYQLKRCGNKNKDEDNSSETLSDKNQQASSQKFRQLMLRFYHISTIVGYFMPNPFSFK